MDSYATTGELATWLDTDPPDNAVTMLRSASVLVARAANLNLYAPLPTDATQLAALRDATTAQVAFWIDAGITSPGQTLTEPLIKMAKVLTGEYQHDTTGVPEQMKEAAESVCAEAADILFSAGLLYSAAPAYADAGGGLARWGLDARPAGSYRGNASEFWGESIAGSAFPFLCP